MTGTPAFYAKRYARLQAKRRPLRTPRSARFLPLPRRGLGLGRSDIGIQRQLRNTEHRADLGDWHRVIVVELDSQVGLSALRAFGLPRDLTAANSAPPMPCARMSNRSAV